ncbi:MAG: Calx-beta domain-containing protein, partial [Chthoniobacter sp.]|uniref:Calx-beta domain-containing protein n=1 Tax=Chthoniobacter sp. TaxID=2510640 RepID=UPI0032AD3FE8
MNHRIATFQDGTSYVANVYGRRASDVLGTRNDSLNGVAVDNQFAVNEDPFRKLEAGERPDGAKQIVTSCPVSGKQVTSPANATDPVPADTTVIETPEQIVYLCGGNHLGSYQTLLYAEGGTGGPIPINGILPGVPTPSVGVLKVLYIPMTFQDQNKTQTTESKAYEIMRDVADFYAKGSYGKLTTISTVTPAVKVPHTEAWYTQKDTSNGGTIDGLSLEFTHAKEEAKKIGFDFDDYDCIVVRLSGGPRSSGVGGYGGGSQVWLYFDSVTIAGHEIGHTFGLSHANFWDTSGTSAIGAGTNAEYGDQYDIMGSGNTPTDHYNAQAKNQIKWLPNDYVSTITQSGTYRLYAMDQPILDPANRYAIKIVKDSQRTYWGEVRQLYNGNATRPWADKGMLLGWTFTGGANGSNIQLIDTTPGSPFAKDDAPISLGRTFSDYESGIHITTTNVSSTTPKYVDVVVNLGQFPGNRAPTLDLASSADFVPVGATVTFTATATDLDGDPLAYSWQNFGDTSVKIVSPNSNVITRTFSTAGIYIVSCTASDMKGGSTTRNKLITVGNGNGHYTISGRITAGGVGLANVIITANSANGVVTDSDGYYIIPNLTATTYSMTPLLYGYTFSETFNNSVTVGPNFGGADFVAQATPVVTIAATVPNAQEPGTGTPLVAGHFTLTRNGDTTQPLTVNVNSASGTATKNTDYTFTPDYITATQGFSTFTFPADSATLDITVTPLSDSAAEGPETVILQLGPGNGYLVGTSSTAQVTITDDPLDTSLPKVSLTAGNSKTIEGSGVPGTVTFQRTGSTANALMVNYTASGTATPGTDYVTLPGSVTIPAGAASAFVNVTPIDDSVSEPLETVVVTTAANPNYIVESVASTATVSIVDDDVQVVSVTATDATAREVDLTVPGAQPDTGTFLITRTGDTTNPLTVYYALSGPTTASMALNGVDFETLPGVLVIPAGASNAAVTIIPRYDGLGEGREYVTLTLGAGPTNYQVGANNNATISIDDAATDLPYVEVISLANASEPSTTGTFRISVKGSGTSPLTVNYTVGGTAVAGSDYTSIGASTTITLNNGTTTKDITVSPINNAVANDLRTITLSVNASANYQTFAPSSTATMFLLDDEQPTVFVDANSTTTPPSITEGGTAGSFYISRTGSTTSALTVNFVLSGTAVSGVDYTASSTTSATIPAGAQGVDVTLTPVNDAIFQGTRTISLTFANGAYGRGPAATMYLNDNETSTQKVAFASASGSGLESVTSVNIPVTLTSAATAPVTVEYVVDTGARTSASTTVGTSPTLTLPYWVRVVRSGTSFTNYASTNGVTWIQRGPPQTISMSSASYLVGLVASSGGSGVSATATLDNLSITGLDAGGNVGTSVASDIGSPSPSGSNSLASGTYTITAGGPDLATGTTDAFRYVYFPITNSANCTITARLVSVSGSFAAAKGGVMIRESVASNAIHDSTITLKDSSLRQTYRLTTGAAGLVNATTTKPYWVRLQRAGDIFSSFISPDGSTWTQLGTNQTMALSNKVLAGLAVSARTDGLLSTATFDNVALTGSPLLQSRTIGFVNAQGSDSLNAGVYTVTGSGAQIGGTEDEAHFVAAPITGDFTLTARVLTQSGGAVNAQAGVMVRELPGYRSRSLYNGLVANAGAEFIVRGSTVTDAFGDGVDFSLPSGTLTFNVGDTTQYIPLSVINDTIAEPDEQISLLLRNASGAQLGTQTTYTYTIIDDDSPPVLPSVGFASTSLSALENSGTANVLVSLSMPSTSTVTVDYSVTAGTATAGADFTASAGTLTFTPGETVKAIAVTLLDDTLVESSETVLLNLTHPVGVTLSAQNAATLTILDDDTPTVNVVATSPNATESGTPGVFTFTRTGSLSGALTVNFSRSGTATSGTDYTAIAILGTVTIPSGQASATLNVTPIQDTLNEGTETVIITLTAGSYTIGSSNTATVNVADDDRSTVNIVANDPNASETPGNPGQFTITRTAPTSAALTVNLTITGTATNGTDYTTISSTATIPAGQSSVTINVLPIDDAVTEGVESVVLQIASGSYDIGPNSFATVTIADNDSPPTLFISSPTAQGPLIATGNGL